MGTPQSDILNPRHPPNKRQIVSLNNQQWPNQSLERLSTSVLPPLGVLAITCTTLVETQRSLRSKSRLICLVLLQRSSRRSQDVPRKLRRRARSGQMRLAKLDNAVDKSKAELAKAEGKFDQYRKDAGAKIDAADRKIENKAAEAKSGISSRFGGK